MTSTVPAAARNERHSGESQATGYVAVMIDRVRRANWLSLAGRGHLPVVERASDWTEAVTMLLSGSLENACRESTCEKHRQQRRRFIVQHQRNWKPYWVAFNERYDEANKQNMAIVHSLIRRFGHPAINDTDSRRIARQVEQCLSETLTLASVLGGVVDHLNRTSLEYYLLGYFPCAYHGKYPHGRLVVY